MNGMWTALCLASDREIVMQRRRWMKRMAIGLVVIAVVAAWWKAR